MARGRETGQITETEKDTRYDSLKLEDVSAVVEKAVDDVGVHGAVGVALVVLATYDNRAWENSIVD